MHTTNVTAVPVAARYLCPGDEFPLRGRIVRIWTARRDAMLAPVGWIAWSLRSRRRGTRYVTCSNATESPQSARRKAECHRRETLAGDPNPPHCSIETWTLLPAPCCKVHLHAAYIVYHVHCCALHLHHVLMPTTLFGPFFLRLTQQTTSHGPVQS